MCFASGKSNDDVQRCCCGLPGIYHRHLTYASPILLNRITPLSEFLMFMPCSRVRIFACLEPIDMRKSFSGLSGTVRSILNQDPLSGHVFLFFNKRRNYVKLLWWDRTGYCIVAKKLTRGVFSATTKGVLTTAEASQLLEGFELSQSRKSRYYEYLPE